VGLVPTFTGSIPISEKKEAHTCRCNPIRPILELGELAKIATKNLFRFAHFELNSHAIRTSHLIGECFALFEIGLHPPMWRSLFRLCPGIFHPNPFCHGAPAGRQFRECNPIIADTGGISSDNLAHQWRRPSRVLRTPSGTSWPTIGYH